MDKGINRAVKLAGSQTALAEILGLTPQAIQKWVANQCFPRTEWTGETNYSSVIAKKFKGQVTRNELLTRPDPINI